MFDFFIRTFLALIVFFLTIFRSGLYLALYIIGGILVAGTLANIHAWAKALCSLFISQSRHLKKALKNNEGAPLTALGAEVSLMTDMVKVGITYKFFLYLILFSLKMCR